MKEIFYKDESENDLLIERFYWSIQDSLWKPLSHTDYHYNDFQNLDLITTINDTTNEVTHKTYYYYQTQTSGILQNVPEKIKIFPIPTTDIINITYAPLSK